MSRDWTKFENDEIYAIWHSYIKTEFGNDPLFLGRPFNQAIRLTSMEIIRLVEELLNRLEIKDKSNVEKYCKKCKNEMVACVCMSEDEK